jgi:hypothetical protein
MMKILQTISVIVLGVVAMQSYAREKQKEVYEFPEAMAQPVRDEYTRLCEKGRILYEINCAKCHNTVVKGKKIVPDFTEEQLGAYSIRVANAKHEEQVSESNVSAEELALITTYLTYKKKNTKQ